MSMRKGERDRRGNGAFASCALICLVAVFIGSFAIASTTATERTATMTTVTVNAPEYVEEGGKFTATIDIDDVINFSAAQFDLSFNSSVIDVNAVRNGEINGETVPIYMWAHDPHDANTIRAVIMMTIGKSVNSSGYLAEIEFTVKGQEGAKSALKPSNVELRDVNGEEIPANWNIATVVVGTEPAVPPEETPTPLPGAGQKQGTPETTSGFSALFAIVAMSGIACLLLKARGGKSV